MNIRTPKAERRAEQVAVKAHDVKPTPETPLAPTHPLYDRSQRRLREIVDVCMGSHDGMPLLNVLLSRVPTIGEEVSVEAKLYRVIGVQHSALDPDGREAFGTHAYLTVVEVPDAGWLHHPERPLRRRTRRAKSRVKKPAAQAVRPQSHEPG